MRIYGILALIALVVIAACSPNTAAPASSDTESNQAAVAASATPVPPTDEPTVEPTHEMMAESMDEATEEPMAERMESSMDDESMAESMDEATEEPMAETMDESSDAMMAETTAYSGPAWTHVELTNAHTGETFTLADFAGKTVYVEPMATWCSNCRAQQRTVIDVADSLGMDDYVFISLSVETNVSDQQLADYADSNGFDWLFAVTTPEMLTALTADYGRSVNVPPSTPHFLIAPDGTVSQLYTGMDSASKLTELLTAVGQG